MTITAGIAIVFLLLLVFYLEQEMEPLLARKLGNIGFITMLGYSVFVVLVVTTYIRYYYFHQSDDALHDFSIRRIWLQNALIFIATPLLFTAVLLYSRMNAMMFVAGIVLWVMGLFHYPALYVDPGIKGYDTISFNMLKLEGFAVDSFAFVGLLVLIAVASALIDRVYDRLAGATD